MGTRYCELADRVISVTIAPDTPGYCRRTVSIVVESGPGLSEEEYDRLSAAVVAGLLAEGADVIGWRAAEGLP